MPEGFHTLQELFNFHENVLPSGVENYGAELRSVSLRITSSSHDYLASLAERWGMSRSALAAQLLEVALNEIEVRETMSEQDQKRADAHRAAL